MVPRWCADSKAVHRYPLCHKSIGQSRQSREVEMDYSKANKAAWEEAFAKHRAGYKEDPALRLRRGDRSFLETDVIVELEKIGLEGKEVAQICCNNGRELLTLLTMGAAKGTGFDIAENFVGEARRLAREANLNAEFVATDIYDIEDKYSGQFDLVLITIGALCWFEDLGRFFEKVALVLIGLWTKMDILSSVRCGATREKSAQRTTAEELTGSWADSTCVPNPELIHSLSSVRHPHLW
jgi:SAM-dependent methyltransferase